MALRHSPNPAIPLLLLFLLWARSLAASSPDCVDVICPSAGEDPLLGLLQGHRVDLKAARCVDCGQCTDSGYSVCARSLSTGGEDRLVEGAECECAHSGPNVSLTAESPSATGGGAVSVVCRLPPKTGARGKQVVAGPGQGLFRVCYSNAIRKLPVPAAQNSNSDMLVTVEPFWLSDYWRALRPSQLHLYYVFPVTERRNCEGKVLVPSLDDLLWINAGKSKEEVGRQPTIWLCQSQLQIIMSGLESDAEADRVHSLPFAEHRDGTETQYDDSPSYEDDLPPEVQFERDVFAGAEKVRLYYELLVERSHQLKSMAGGKVKFELKRTKVKSDPVDFELHPEKYGNGSAQPAADSATQEQHIDRVGIEVREPIVRPTSARKGHRTSGTPLVHSTSAVPVPNHPSPATAETDRRQPVPSAPSPSTTTRPHRVTTPKGETEDWLLLRNVLLITLLCVALFVGLAICYKKGLGCFGARAPEERNGKTRSVNGKDYREARQK